MLDVCFSFGQMMWPVNNAAINQNKVGFLWMQVGHMMGGMHVIVQPGVIGLRFLSADLHVWA
jgi:hypothetical protein